jgi:hypothetical protein
VHSKDRYTVGLSYDSPQAPGPTARVLSLALRRMTRIDTTGAGMDTDMSVQARIAPDDSDQAGSVTRTRIDTADSDRDWFGSIDSGDSDHAG